MNEILITGDWHIKSGIYTDICMDYINYMMEFCLERGIWTIVIDGDIFEKSSKIHNDAFIPLFFKFNELKEKGFEIIIILGNHDIFSVENDSLVETFSVFGRVVKEFEQIEIGGRTIDLLPYTKNPDDIQPEGDVLITHLSIADFTFDNKFHVSEKAGLKRELFKGYNKVFTGHFHRPQHKGNIVYVGSPYQMNFGERDQKKGFVTFDLDSNEWERHYYTQAPVYKKINAEDFQTAEVENCFVQVALKEKLDNYVKLKHILYEKGAIEVTPLFIEDETEITVDDSKKLDMDNSVPYMVKEYITDNVKMNGISPDKLVSIFEEVLKKVE